MNDRLQAYKADTGERIFEINLGMAQMGPPISFTIDGKQYIAVTGGPGGGGGAPARPANLIVLTLDGKGPLPGAPPAN